MKSFSQFITEDTKEVVFTFGRFNPPTVGHEKLIDKMVSLASGNNYRIFTSQSVDPKKNPLQYQDKIKFMRKMFPKHGRSIIADTKIKTPFDALVQLYDQGFTAVTMVVGSDRVTEFKVTLNKYNGVSSRHGFYNFEKGVKIVSAGMRDPDAEGATGMSGTKMREYAVANDFQTFGSVLPSGFKEAQKLFNAVRTGMGLKESYDFRKHVKLAAVSQQREEFVKNEALFEEKSFVILKETSEVATVAVRGANYLIVEMADGKRYRKWLTDVEPLEPKEI